MALQRTTLCTHTHKCSPVLMQFMLRSCVCGAYGLTGANRHQASLASPKCCKFDLLPLYRKLLEGLYSLLASASWVEEHRQHEDGLAFRRHTGSA